VDLRPQLERLDRLILRSKGIDPAALTFAFRPLWQMDAATKATLALSKAKATQVYAELGLWPAKTTARLVAAQLIEDGTYPGAEAVFAEAGLTIQPEPPSLMAADVSDTKTVPIIRPPNLRSRPTRIVLPFESAYRNSQPRIRPWPRSSFVRPARRSAPPSVARSAD